MDLSMTKKVAPLVQEVRSMILEKIIPVEAEFFEELANSKDRFAYTFRMTEILENLKSEAKSSIKEVILRYP